MDPGSEESKETRRARRLASNGALMNIGMEEASASTGTGPDRSRCRSRTDRERGEGCTHTDGQSGVFAQLHADLSWHREDGTEHEFLVFPLNVYVHTLAGMQHQSRRNHHHHCNPPRAKTNRAQPQAVAVVLHGVPTKYKPGQMGRWIEEDNQGSIKFLGTRWLLSAERRTGKLASSLVIYLKDKIDINRGIRMVRRVFRTTLYDWER